MFGAYLALLCHTQPQNFSCAERTQPHPIPPQEDPNPSSCEGMSYQPLETGAPVKLKIPYRSEEHEPDKRSEFRLCNNNWCPPTTKSGF